MINVFTNLEIACMISTKNIEYIPGINYLLTFLASRISTTKLTNQREIKVDFMLNILSRLICNFTCIYIDNITLLIVIFNVHDYKIVYCNIIIIDNI